LRVGDAGTHGARWLQRFCYWHVWTQHQEVAGVEGAQLKPGVVKHALKIGGKRGLIIGIESKDAAAVHVDTGEACYQVHWRGHPSNRGLRAAWRLR
jgi:hypothetical protein